MQIETLRREDLASAVLYFPMLSAVVEFDMAGPTDLEEPNFMYGNRVSPKTMGCAVRDE